MKRSNIGLAAFSSAVAIQQRAQGEQNTPMFVGLACPYEKWSEKIFGFFREKFLPGAFAESLNSGEDIVCVMNHNREQLLGRTSAGTLRLMEKPEGLYVECDKTDTTYANDLEKLIRSGNIRGMSFEFEPLTNQWGKEDGVNTHIVEKAKLYEVSFVVNPCYPDSQADLRSQWQRQRDNRLSNLDKPENTLRVAFRFADAIATRHRM